MATHDAASNPSSAKAFTLTEMLIVIALIALLLSIVLPSIGRGKELARRTVCRANLGALASAMIAYAQDNKDRVPLACLGAKGSEIRARGYAISYRWVTLDGNPDGQAVPDAHLGLLTLPGEEYVSAPEQFYCPSNRDPAFGYNSSANSWFDKGGGTNAGYTTRPVFAWEDDGGAASEHTSSSGDKLPKMMDFNAGEAMIADILSYPGFLDNHHETGVNVVRFDGSAIWFDEKGFNEQDYDPPWKKLKADTYEANNIVFYETGDETEHKMMDSRITTYKGKCAWYLMGK